MPPNPDFPQKVLRGRGTAGNPAGRFEPTAFTPDPDETAAEPSRPETRFFPDSTRTVLTRNDSPDIPFDVSLNPYRGCEHGCIYCYARPTHEYLGLSAGLDFETRVWVKENAPDLLRRELSRPSWIPQPIAFSGVTDPYQPYERDKRLTRRCLEVLLEFRNPVLIVTKNFLVTRDLDLLREMNRYGGVSVTLSLSSLDPSLASILEPRTSRPSRRLEALRMISDAGIPTGVLLAPVIPALTVEAIPAVLQAAARAGAQYAGYILLRLPHGVADLFADWLEHHFPDRKAKVLSQIRQARDGQLSDSRFGSRMKGRGLLAEQINQLFHLACRNAGIPGRTPHLSAASFRTGSSRQMLLFD